MVTASAISACSFIFPLRNGVSSSRRELGIAGYWPARHVLKRRSVSDVPRATRALVEEEHITIGSKNASVAAITPMLRMALGQAS